MGGVKMKYLTTALFVSSVALFTGCGGGGGSDSPPPADYSGDYDIVTTEMTDKDIYGNFCVSIQARINVTDSIVTGSAVTSNGDALDVDGAVTSTGYVSGGFTIADTDMNVASYEGQMDAATGTGTGTWNDINGCSGTWRAAHEIKVID